MSFFNILYSTVLEALFPTPVAESRVLSLDAQSLWKTLPRAKRFPVAEACSIFSYKDERVWRLIWSLKYKKSARAAFLGGASLYRILSLYARVTAPIIVVPMPVSRKRRRERGYNQCELLADEIQNCQSRNGHEQENRLMIINDLLVRTHHTSRQTMKDRAKRLESAKDIFAINRSSLEKLETAESKGGMLENKQIKDCLVIVIDDVITTGGTIRDATRTLRNAGFQNTFGLSVAH